MEQPCSSEMQAMKSLLHPSRQIPLRDLQNASNTSTHPQIQRPTSPPHPYLLQQMLSSSSCTDLKSPWDDLPSKSDQTAARPSNPENNVGLRYDEFLASKHQINGIGHQSAVTMMMQQQLMISAAARAMGGDGSVQGLYNGFSGGSLNGTNHPATVFNQPHHFNPPQAHDVGAAETEAINQAPAVNGWSGGAAGQPRPRVRARRGQATDPHSIAERLRRERIAERMRALQELVPNANKTDKASMLDEIIDHVKFLQLQVKVLSMSRLGGAAAVAPLVTDMSSEGRGDCIQTSANGTQTQNYNQTVTEQQVAKLMDEDMGAAMQYLQGKGLCLVPISLAATVSTVPCRSSNPGISNYPNGLLNGEGPSSPTMSVLTVQSATKRNGGVDGSLKDSASVSKPQ